MSPPLQRAAWSELYLALERPLFNIALRWTWNAAEAEELVQEVFLRLWQRRRRIEAAGARAYAFRSLLNLAQKHARRRELWQRVRTGLGLPVATPEPDQAYHHCELRSAIEALPVDLRQALLLCEYSGLKQREIALLLSIPMATVASRRRRAIEVIKRGMDEADIAKDH